MVKTTTVLAGLAMLLLLPGFGQARPAHKQTLAQFFGPFLAKKLNDCRTCHLPDPVPAANKPGDEDKPHNPFGARLKSVKEDLRKAGKKTALEDRLQAILDEDSDGDGVSNLLEILTGHFPGDKSDRPSAEELAAVKTTLAAFRKFQGGYPWRPFEPVRRPALPSVKANGWVRNPVDAFIAAEHESQGLKPRPEAPRHVLLRRVYIDLTGLPPTAAELDAFLADTSPDAYEKVVDRLLASSRYGERWGRHWMDVWRYSDWAGWGAQVRDSQPHIWRWRDWIIASLNEDKGYDRMVLEMLAGDELAPEDPKTLAATGFLVRNFKLLSREKWLQDTVEHTSAAFLGVTLACARCHDHMFDPILQKDYYRMRAVFEPHQVRIDRLPGQADVNKDGVVRVFDADIKAATYLYLRGDDRTPDKSKPLVPGVPDVLGGEFPAKIEPIKLPASARCPDKRDFVVAELIRKAEAAVAEAQTKQKQAGNSDLAGKAILLAEAQLDTLRKVLAAEKLEDDGKADSDAGRGAAKEALLAQRRLAVIDAQFKVASSLAEKMKPAPTKGAKVDPQKALDDARKQLAKAEADEKLPVTTNYTRRTLKTYPTESSGRRLALARWLTQRDHPLTARVAVNHIWLRHFGQALVPSVFDFGRNGREPSHPALLDWLAAELMDSGWSMKKLHRTIVMSSTYRLASTTDAGNLAIDRDNKYLWRLSPRAVEAEAVRDAVFYVAGKLDLTMGGPDIDYPLGLTVPRRSVYFRTAAEKQMEFLQIFDGPSVIECYERKPSIVPQQALALVNSELTIKNARILARTLSPRHADDGNFTKAAFAQVLSRSPTAEELAECGNFLRQQAERFRGAGKVGGAADADGRTPSPDPAMRARENLIHVLLNHHEFVTLR